MRDMTGVASKIFKTLLTSDIPFYQVTTSEISVSYVVDEATTVKKPHVFSARLLIYN